MKCNCGYITENKKSFSNHIRFGCPNEFRSSGVNCKYCGLEMTKKKPSEQGLYCNHKCYAKWRSENNIGKNAPNYVHGRCGENLLFRASLKYREWRKAVFKRDNYTCVICMDKKGGNLEADHIKDFALYPELRLNIDNGRTLCKSCHKKTENYGFKKSNTAKRN
jgi:hypothetical protein